MRYTVGLDLRFDDCYATVEADSPEEAMRLAGAVVPAMVRVVAPAIGQAFYSPEGEPVELTTAEVTSVEMNDWEVSVTVTGVENEEGKDETPQD